MTACGITSLRHETTTLHPLSVNITKTNTPDSPPSLAFRVLDRAGDVLRLKIREAYAIQDQKPPLNRRQEHHGTGFLAQSHFFSFLFFSSFFTWTNARTRNL